MDTNIDTEEWVVLPGFGLPVQEMPSFSFGGKRTRFPHAIADFFASKGVTLRELRMLEFINQITDKPGWEEKVFNSDILSKWRAEVSRPADVPGEADVHLSEQMFDYCVSELQEKAVRFKEKGFVSILDAEISLVKSDVAVSTTLQQSLKNAVQPLEDIAEHLKDWHPGSGGKVLDLVHPSLFPAVYGLSRVLPVGSVPLNGSCEYIGKGETLPVGVGNGGGRHEKFAQWAEKQVILQAWGNYQWLPAAVKFDPNGKAKITSYINNLHPTKYQDLYQVLEQCVDASIPLWNEVLSFFHNRTRIHISATSDEDYALPAGVKYHEEEFDEWDDAYIEWKRAHHYLIWPEPEPFKSFEASAANKDGVWPVDLKNDFSETGLQIIFKLANIHLTPEMPTYDGGAWHIEGALNEHICATALYYYDEENITASHLAFRQAIDCEELVMKPAQSEFGSLEEFFGVLDEGTNDQKLGEVLTREGRLLCFPNVLQHRVSPFKLADSTKNGHRKILAIFLVDPDIPVLSTANIPPQRRDWWAAEIRQIMTFARLPLEIFERIIDSVEGFPIPWETALDIRELLMEERSVVNEDVGEGYKATFSFCEH